MGWYSNIFGTTTAQPLLLPLVDMKDLMAANAALPVPAPKLRLATLAHWAQESDFGRSELAWQHRNFAKMAWNEQLAEHASILSAGATKVELAEPGAAAVAYYAFTSNEAFVRGYWRRIVNSLATMQWRDYETDEAGFVRYVASKWRPADSSYGDTLAKLLVALRKQTEQGPATDQRLPPAYFMFASSPPRTVDEIRQAAQDYKRILVGFDSGGIRDDAMTASSLAAAKGFGAELEIYVEGPGGPTGDSWSDGERQRVKAAANSVGIDTGGHEASWIKEWDAWGWKTFTYKQLKGFLDQGYSACEIDNLSRVIDTSQSFDGMIKFYVDYGERFAAGRLPRLVMKNIDAGQMKVVADAVIEGRLPRAMFSEFHIFERAPEATEADQIANLARINGQSVRIAVRTVESIDTFNYRADGVFGLEDAFAALFPKTA